ncbi:hypothetical protein ACF09E_34785 [Streptomyces sp. NPDC014891]|uniref:hypothetical protein n=1 Tax=Streptomyces sp. NPDC014891 TaxID=3364929 RepID=UPI0036F8B7B3
MKTIDGHPYANRDDLAERSGYSRATLAAMWRDRATNNHPAARTVDRGLYWNLEEWEAWFATYSKKQRDQMRTVDRSGDPDEELPPAAQARVLGVDASRITQYGKKPPANWPAPVRTETLPSGRVREYRTRRQLWDFHDTTNRAGTAGRAAKEGTDPRFEQAAQALAEEPGRPAAELVALLAERHGGAPNTWRPFVTEARKNASQPED